VIRIHESERFRRSIAAASLVAFVAAVTLGSLPACGRTADAAHEPTSAPEPDDVLVAGRTIMLLVDLSASMNRPVSDEVGVPSRLDEAKRAVVDVIGALPAEAVVGLRVYGDGRDAVSAADRGDACASDTRQIVAPAPLDRSALTAAITGLTARGDTPIGVSMQAAAADIARGEPGTIILVTDGRDECYDADLDGDPAVGPSFGPAPCDVAATIRDQRAELRVHVVGFDTTNYDLQSLACFADETGGTVVNTNDAAALGDQLVGLAVGTRRGVVPLGGTPVDGTRSIAEAPPIAGQLGSTSRFVDEVSRDLNGEQSDGATDTYVAHYDVDLIRGAGFAATATVFGLPTEVESVLTLSLIAADGTRTLLRAQNDRAGRAGTGVDSVRLVGWAYEQQAQRIDGTIELGITSRSLTDELHVELTLDGASVLGGPPNCPPETDCQYREIVPLLSTYLDDLNTRIESTIPAGEVVDPLVDDVLSLEGQVDALGGSAPAAPGDRSVLPLVALAVAALALGAGIASRRSRIAAGEAQKVGP
jgi:hypothetical protein